MHQWLTSRLKNTCYCFLSLSHSCITTFTPGLISAHSRDFPINLPNDFGTINIQDQTQVTGELSELNTAAPRPWIYHLLFSYKSITRSKKDETRTWRVEGCQCIKRKILLQQANTYFLLYLGTLALRWRKTSFSWKPGQPEM